VGDFLQQVLRVHGLYASTFRSDLRAPRLGRLGRGAGAGPQRTKRAGVRQPQNVPLHGWEAKWEISQLQKTPYSLRVVTVGGLRQAKYVGSWEVSHKMVGGTRLKPGASHRARAARRWRSQRCRWRRRIRTA